jgi:L-iditol 2-dehydrogenase
MTKARIAFLHGPEDLRVEERDVPDPGPYEVLIAGKSVGICGSDVECYEGVSAEGRYDIAPYAPGHEWAGEVVAVGSAVTSLKPGDKVTGDCVQDCGRCANCKDGLMPSACLNMRELGFRPDSPGGLSELLILDERFTHKFPDSWSFELGSIVEPFSVAHFGIWGNGGWVDASDTVLVLGSGMIGLCSLIVAKAAGARTIVSEPLDYRADYARRYGADEVIDPIAAPIEEQVEDLTGGRMASVVVEASGNDTAIASVFDVAGHSARVRLVGHSVGRKVPVEIGLTIWKTLAITGSGGTKTFMPRSIRFMERIKDSVDLEGLITDRFAFADVHGAFHRAVNAKVEAMKVTINL